LVVARWEKELDVGALRKGLESHPLDI